MSKSAQTKLEVYTPAPEDPEVGEDEKPCPHDWCNDVVHKNRWPVHVRNCTPDGESGNGGGGVDV